MLFRLNRCELFSARRWRELTFWISDFAYQTEQEAEKFLMQAERVLLGVPNRVPGKSLRRFSQGEF